MRLSTRTLLLPNKHWACFTAVRLCVETHFHTGDKLGPHHWPLVPGVWWPGFDVLPATARPQSLAGN